MHHCTSHFRHSAVTPRCVRAGSQGKTLGATPSLRQMLAELMQTSVKTGFCAGECFLDIDETRHYFVDQYVDPRSPCIVYICDVRPRIIITLVSNMISVVLFLVQADTGKVKTQKITCSNTPCPRPEDTLYVPGKCCHTCGK